MMESHRRCSGIMNPPESRSVSQGQPSCFCCTSQCSGHLPPPNLGNAPAPGSEGALHPRAAAACLLSKLHESHLYLLPQHLPSTVPDTCVYSSRTAGSRGRGVFAEVLKAIRLTRERGRTGSQETHMNKLFDLGQVPLGARVSSLEKEDNCTFLIGSYEVQIKD